MSPEVPQKPSCPKSSTCSFPKPAFLESSLSPLMEAPSFQVLKSKTLMSFLTFSFSLPPTSNLFAILCSISKAPQSSLSSYFQHFHLSAANTIFHRDDLLLPSILAFSQSCKVQLLMASLTSPLTERLSLTSIQPHWPPPGSPTLHLFLPQDTAFAVPSAWSTFPQIISSLAHAHHKYHFLEKGVFADFHTPI